MAPDLTEPTEAAARALWNATSTDPWEDVPAMIRFEVSEQMLTAITAAAPLIEAQVRERVAREIEDRAEQEAVTAGWTCDHMFTGAHCHVCFENAAHAAEVAARIARGRA